LVSVGTGAKGHRLIQWPHPGGACRTPDGRTPTRSDWQRLSHDWQAELDQRIHQLQQLRDQFTDCIGCGCLSIDRCALANPHDALDHHGPGPRRLLNPEHSRPGLPPALATPDQPAHDLRLEDEEPAPG
jgi:MerR, DNA binding